MAYQQCLFDTHTHPPPLFHHKKLQEYMSKPKNVLLNNFEIAEKYVASRQTKEKEDTWASKIHIILETNHKIARSALK